jgi:hypothetical protein
VLTSPFSPSRVGNGCDGRLAPSLLPALRPAVVRPLRPCPDSGSVTNTFLRLNGVYLVFLNEESAAEAIERVLPMCGWPPPGQASMASSGMV